MQKIIILLISCVLAIFGIKAQEVALNLDYLDKTIKPSEDFYNYTNGGWMKIAEIPSDRSRWGSFDELREFTDSVSLQILKKSLANKSNDKELQKLADLYNSIIDLEYREKIGISPLLETYKRIQKIKNVADLENYFIEQSSNGGNLLYGFYVGAHSKKSNENALYLYGGNLGLGRDYYQKEDEKSKETLEKYAIYISQLIEAAKIPIENNAKSFVEFEKTIGKSIKSIEEIRNSQLRYNPVKISDLKEMVQNINLEKYISSFNIQKDTVIIPEIGYYKNLDRIINKENLSQIKDYLMITKAMESSNYLNEELGNLYFEFFNKTLRGQQEQRPLEKRALATINSILGEVLGKLYVKEVFPPEAKTKAEEMVYYLKKSFEMHIKNLHWMSSETKNKALEKLSKFNVKIGYPDKWKDYSALKIESIEDGGSFYQNYQNYTSWRFYDNLSEITKVVDKTKWGMNPQTVNAYYSSSFNEIVFPAAILQAPFYNYKADAAVNFGGIGAVIGHEISHGFDDSGSQYDGDGNLNNWWTDEDHKKFSEASDALAAQYSAYEPLPGVFVNGKFTLGENIADLGGVSVAYDAHQMYLKENRSENKTISNYTPEQRFFLSWATIWRSKYTDEALANQVKTDPHSPGYYRAIGPLINLESFYKAFKVKQGDKMYKELADRITIW